MVTTTANKRPDRRIQRTRQLLFQAFAEVAREKDFAAISVQDITERANVNRGTFYAHFADKYALLELFVREDFRRHLTDQLAPNFQCDQHSELQPFILIVLEYFQAVYGHCRPPEVVAPLIERALHEELRGMLLNWLRQSGGADARWRVPIETIAYIISWSIFGAANQFCRATPRASLEQLASDVQLVIMGGVTGLAEMPRLA